MSLRCSPSSSSSHRRREATRGELPLHARGGSHSARCATRSLTHPAPWRGESAPQSVSRYDPQRRPSARHPRKGVSRHLAERRTASHMARQPAYETLVGAHSRAPERTPTCRSRTGRRAGRAARLSGGLSGVEGTRLRRKCLADTSVLGRDCEWGAARVVTDRKGGSRMDCALSAAKHSVGRPVPSRRSAPANVWCRPQRRAFWSGHPSASVPIASAEWVDRQWSYRARLLAWQVEWFPTGFMRHPHSQIV